jgi:hypothetical protein
MAYVIGFLAFGLLLGLVYLILRRALDHPWWALAVVAAAVIGVPRYVEHLERELVLGHIPAELGPPVVGFNKQESWGIGGPGDNETGVIAYELPELPLARLNKEGLAFLRGLPSQTGNDVRGTWYHMWTVTPVTDANWLHRRGDGNPDPRRGGPSLAAYIDRYGFAIEVDAQVEQAINRALASPGSFVGHTRGGGVLLLVPQSRKAFFIYAG